MKQIILGLALILSIASCKKESQDSSCGTITAVFHNGAYTADSKYTTVVYQHQSNGKMVEASFKLDGEVYTYHVGDHYCP